MIRLMIIAKHIEVLQGLSTVLRLSGEVEVAAATSSLDQVVQQAAFTHPDVFLVDGEMPGGEGYEIIHQLRHLYPSAKVIALTAHDYPAARQSAIRAGADCVMLKGMDVPEMIAIINQEGRQPIV